VAAVDRFLEVAKFSNGGLNPNGGKIDIAAPGVDTYSSAPDPAPPRQPPFFRPWSGRYDAISGTSMATPHVAGVAALIKQAKPNATPEDVRRELIESARDLSLPNRDVGAGLVQAPRVAPPDGTASIRVIG
ncbi:MAG: S8 family serine peptidase, partial [Planctomycetota bacterium]